MKSQSPTRQGIVDSIKLSTSELLGYANQFVIILDTTPYVCNSGEIIIAIKAKDSDVVYSAAVAMDGTTSVTLLNTTQNDIDFVSLSSVTLASGKAYLYLATKP